MADLIRRDLVEARYGSASNLAFNEEIKSLIKQGQTIYHFGFGQAPFPVLEAATEALKKHAGENAYLAVNGIQPLRSAICNFHAHFDKLTFDPEDVIVAPGSKELILLLMTVFNGDVLVNSPSWTTYKPQAVLAGRRHHVIESREEEGWRVTPRGVREVCQRPGISNNKLLILCNPCNPTSTCYTPDQLKELTEEFRQHNVIVLSDEIYARLHFTGNHCSLAHYYPEGTILSSGLSKWASAGGWRMGYNIYPPQLRPLLSTVKSAGSHSYSCAPAPMQFAFAEALSNIPACTEYIEHTARVMRRVGDFCTRELRSVGVKVVEPTAGYYMFPDFRVIQKPLAAKGVTTGEQMCALMLKEARVAVLAGGPAHLRPDRELTVRLCFVNFDGRQPLAESRRLGLTTELSPDFVRELCSPVYHGIMALKAWVNSYKA